MNNQLAVLLPYYNNLNGLRLTLESLVQETETFTLFIFDDGSDDKVIVKGIIEGISNKFEIIYIRSEINRGITITLNNGLKHIISLNRFYLIAKLHAGDLCLNNRFKRQKELLDKEDDIFLIGSWVRFVNMKREFLFNFKPPSQHHKIKKVIHLYNPFIHPSVMFKIEVVDKIGYYPENYPALEDHAYFFKIVKTFKTSIIEEVLLEYEVNPLSISSLQRRAVTKSRIKLLLNEYNLGLHQTLGLIRALITYVLPLKLLILIKKNFSC